MKFIVKKNLPIEIVLYFNFNANKRDSYFILCVSGKKLIAINILQQFFNRFLVFSLNVLLVKFYLLGKDIK